MSKRPTGQIVTRFAPSPTGYLHIGGARTALFNWAFARRHGGVFILRIEDTDKARSTDAATQRIIEDMRWLGIDWDEGPERGGDFGPYYQSARDHLYNEFRERMYKAGRAYRCFKSPDQLKAEREAQKAAGAPMKYDPTESLNRSDADQLSLITAGKTYVWRFRMPVGEAITVNDLVLGDVTIKTEELEDFVIFKGDGGPTFHFANIVDDAMMGVTHVLRAQEHLMNTPKHVAMFDALGIDRPKYAHMPLIFNTDGTKMSKRDKPKAARVAAKKSQTFTVDGLCALLKEKILGDSVSTTFPGVPIKLTLQPNGSIRLTRQVLGEAPEEFDEPEVALHEAADEFLSGKSDNLTMAVLLSVHLGITLPEIEVNDFRMAGYLSEVVLNYIALLGWSPGGNIERFDLDWLKQNFTLEGIGKSNAKFDRQKLLAFNAATLQSLPPDKFREHLARIVNEWAKRGHVVTQDLILKLEGTTSEKFAAFAEAYRPRTQILRDPIKAGQFFAMPDDAIVFDPKSVDKVLKNNGGAGFKALGELKAALETAQPWDAPTLHGVIEKFCAATSRGMGDVAQPLRVALTGTSVSPAIHDTLAILGKTSSLKRIERCLALA